MRLLSRSFLSSSRELSDIIQSSESSLLELELRETGWIYYSISKFYNRLSHRLQSGQIFSNHVFRDTRISNRLHSLHLPLSRSRDEENKERNRASVSSPEKTFSNSLSSSQLRGLVQSSALIIAAHSSLPQSTSQQSQHRRRSILDMFRDFKL